MKYEDYVEGNRLSECNYKININDQLSSGNHKFKKEDEKDHKELNNEVKNTEMEMSEDFDCELCDLFKDNENNNDNNIDEENNNNDNINDGDGQE